MPDPEKSLMVPPVTFTSSDVNSVDGSDSVNVNCACSPDFKATSVEVILMVGTTVSTARVIDPAVFSFPAASMNLDGSTLITPSAVLLSSGVNVAV